MVDELAKQLRRNTGYPWRDCNEAANRTTSYWLAVEMLPAIQREREGRKWRGETTR